MATLLPDTIVSANLQGVPTQGESTGRHGFTEGSAEVRAIGGT
jgi:hypothetical protein